jgi:hypothetical protein
MGANCIRARGGYALIVVLVAVFAESAVGNARQQAGGSGDLAVETTIRRVIGEKILRALLSLAAGNVEVGVN